MTNKANIINREFFNGEQSYNLLSNYRFGNKSIKIEIKRDSYDFQSYARSYLFTDQGWESIYSMPYEKMRTTQYEISWLKKEECHKAFMLDELLILDTSKLILGIE